MERRWTGEETCGEATVEVSGYICSLTLVDVRCSSGVNPLYFLY